MGTAALTDWQIGWVIHEAHRALQMTDPLLPENVMPAPPWITMTKWQQEIVMDIPRALRERKARHPGIWAKISDRFLAEMVHANWVLRMKEAGWAQGEEKDPIRKTHPDLTAWMNLPPHQQAKSLQAVAIARVHI